MKNITTYLSILLIATTSIALVNKATAQDVHFTDPFYGNPLRLNPAIMGMNSDLKAILNYRTQWSGIDKGYSTTSFTGLYPLYVNEGERKLDFGLDVMNDKAGAYSTMDFALAIGYNLKITNTGFISVSLLGGFVQKSLDAGTLNFDDQYVLGNFNSSNPTNANIASEKVSYPDVGFGLMWYFTPSRDDAKLNAYLGVAGYHMNEPDETFISGGGKLPRKLSYQGGVKIYGDNKLDFTPNLRVTTQSGSEEVAAGIYIDYHLNETAALTFGTWYRKNDALAALLKFDHKSFGISYGYDVSSSEINKAITGLKTHEITLTFKMDQAEKKGIDVNKSFF